MGRIPQDFINDLLNRVDVVDVIEERLPLRKAGKNYQALCPFHGEKTPSFSVSPDKQFYYCFGCGASGTAITFLMEYDHMDFPEAVRELASRCGLTVPETAGERQHRRDDDIYRILGRAADEYARQLREHPQAPEAVDYLKSRGLTGRAAARFGLGFAPPGWSHLLEALGGDEPARQQLAAAGLIIARDDGGYYDRFRQRIMFPIRDHRGRTIGFGGRAIGDEEPKYLNSPETAVFHKGRELYGLFEFRQTRSAAQHLLVVEGYMDVLALHQFGVPAAVATLGTATTADHLNRLFRIVPEVVFCFDGDAAGQRAAWRALETSLPLLSEGRSASFLFIPPGEDPDSLVRARGADYFQDAEQRSSLSSFLFQELSKELDTDTLDGQARLIDRAMPLINKVPGAALQRLLTSHLAGLTGLEARELRGMAGEGRRGPRPLRSRRQPLPDRPRRSLVRTAISLLLHRPALGAGLEDTERLHQLQAPGAELLWELLALTRRQPELSCAGVLEHFRGHASEEHLKKLASREPEAPESGWEAEFQGAIRGLLKQLDKKPPYRLGETPKPGARRSELAEDP